jgi:hypothetical protein
MKSYVCIYGLFDAIASSSVYVVTSGRMVVNNELEGVWMEAAVGDVRYCLSICLGELKETLRTITGP